jgi:hypothetical protein
MATIKRAKRDTPFVIIDKTALQDNRLSWKAKGLLAYLLSLPDDWKVYVKELSKHATDGRDATNTAIKELIKVGYITRERVRGEDGQFTGWDYTVTENGFSVNGKPENGKSENGKSVTTNNDYTNNDYTNNNLIEGENEFSPTPAPEKKVSRFVPPTLEECISAFKEKLREKKVLGFDRIAQIEAEKFFNHYGANGWMVGKNKMKSWPHSVGGWLSRMDQYKTTTTKLNHNEGIISTDDAHAIIDDIVANGW